MTTTLTQEERVAMTQSLMRLFDEWRISAVDQIALLGLRSQVKVRSLRRFRQSTPLPPDQETDTRAYYLLEIGIVLETSFPHNRALASYWVTTPNRLFSNRTPLDVMLSRGLEGMRRIHGHLSRTDVWG